VLESEGEECALFVDAANTGDFAAAIDRLLGDPVLAARKVALGRRLASRYSVRNMVETYASLIRRVRGAETAGEGATSGLAPRQSSRP
jgi:glycosyltransferase involved in cell wall biosynthesis